MLAQCSNVYDHYLTSYFRWLRPRVEHMGRGEHRALSEDMDVWGTHGHPPLQQNSACFQALFIQV